MTAKTEPVTDLNEIANAEAEGRPVLVSRLFRYDHLAHEIPLGSLVEVEVTVYSSRGSAAFGETAGSEVHLKGRCKLFVVALNRDCDGEPLYSLCDLPVSAPTETREDLVLRGFANLYRHGYTAEQLTPLGRIVPLYQSVRALFGVE